MTPTLGKSAFGPSAAFLPETEGSASWAARLISSLVRGGTMNRRGAIGEPPPTITRGSIHHLQCRISHLREAQQSPLNARSCEGFGFPHRPRTIPRESMVHVMSWDAKVARPWAVARQPPKQTDLAGNYGWHITTSSRKGPSLHVHPNHVPSSSPFLQDTLTGNEHEDQLLVSPLSVELVVRDRTRHRTRCSRFQLCS